jgi:hypothetical protein
MNRLPVLKTTTNSANATNAPFSNGVLQRKCSCGQHTAGGGECEECKKKRLQRQEGREVEPQTVPQIVHEVLRSPGSPLDQQARALMEPRFGQDFSRVRVHTDTNAAESARVVNALAYTVGQNVVFGAGQYAPGSDAGRHLLAHELTHVVQQKNTQNNGSTLRLDSANSQAESEAMRNSREFNRNNLPLNIQSNSSGNLIARQREQDPGQTPPAPSEPTSKDTCGPNVTPQVTSAVSKTKSTFSGWSTEEKEGGCQALISFSTGAYAWDIVDLHNNRWILDYRPACATRGAEPPCGSSVQVGSDCYYAGSPNYVIYGVMMKVCHDHYSSAGKTSDAEDFTKSEMEDWIDLYKGTGPIGISTPSGNFGPSRDWAIAGYDGWPASGTPPAGDRNNCDPSCPTAYSGPDFNVNWVPNGVF